MKTYYLLVDYEEFKPETYKGVCILDFNLPRSEREILRVCTGCLKDFCKDSKCFAFNEAEKGNYYAKLYCINYCQAYAFQQYINKIKAKIVSFDEEIN